MIRSTMDGESWRQDPVPVERSWQVRQDSRRRGTYIVGIRTMFGFIPDGIMRSLDKLRGNHVLCWTSDTDSPENPPPEIIRP